MESRVLPLRKGLLFERLEGLLFLRVLCARDTEPPSVLEERRHICEWRSVSAQFCQFSAVCSERKGPGISVVGRRGFLTTRGCLGAARRRRRSEKIAASLGQCRRKTVQMTRGRQMQ